MEWNNCKLIYDAQTKTYAEDMSEEEKKILEDYKYRYSYEHLGLFDDYPYLENSLIQLDVNAGEIYPSRQAWRKYSSTGREESIFRIHESGINIWYDIVDRAVFSAFTCVRKDGPIDIEATLSDHYRKIGAAADKMIKTTLSDAEKPLMLDLNSNFSSNTAWGVQSITKLMYSPEQIARELGNNLPWRTGASPELVFREAPKIDRKVTGKKVLIIGAGPSLEGFDYDLDRYDTIVTCNNFLMHDKVSKLPIDLLYLSNDTYTKQEILDYFNEKSELGLLFDTAVRRRQEIVAEYLKTRPDDILIYNTRIFTRTTGVAPRLIALMAVLGATEISFVGVDGQVKEDYVSRKSRSVFEKGKEIPSHHCDHELKWYSHNREFVLVWDYLINYLPERLKGLRGYAPVYRNLGENYEKNMIADISKKMFPLEEGG